MPTPHFVSVEPTRWLHFAILGRAQPIYAGGLWLLPLSTGRAPWVGPGKPRQGTLTQGSLVELSTLIFTKCDLTGNIKLLVTYLFKVQKPTT